MKKIGAAAAVCAIVVSFAYAASVTVIVEEATVKKRPQFYAPTVVKVKLGDSVDAGALQNGWYQVTKADQSGWLHQSAVTTKAGRVSAGAWQGDNDTTASEVTLAGKGFNESVENDYRKANPSLDFSAVDKMESRSLSDEALIKFAQDGGLMPPGKNQ